MAKPTNAAIVDLKGRKWDPFNTEKPSGYVTYDEVKGEIHVPYGTDPVSKTIQAHELAHVRYTSKVWPNATTGLKRLTEMAGTRASIVGYAEDMRITALAGRLGVKTLPTIGNKDDQPIIDRWVESFVDAGIPRKRAERASRFILNEHTSVLKRMGLTLATLQEKKNAERYITVAAGLLHKLLSKGEEPSGEKPKPSEKSKGAAPKDKDKRKTEPSPDEPEEDEAGDEGDDSKPEAGTDKADKGKGEGDEPAPGDKDDSEGEGEGEGDEEGDETEGDADPSSPSDGTADTDGGKPIDLSHIDLPDVRAAMLASVPPPPNTQELIQNFQHTLNTATWYPVPTIARVPLVRRAAHALRKGRKLSEVGVALGSAYDAVSPNERRPFVAKRKGGAGGLTVVIDCSGSMQIQEAQLEQLLLKHPQGVVVTYSSFLWNMGGRKPEAVVRIIASHGRVAAQKDFRDEKAGGNGCDGPMLEWLAKQSGERVWVCDGILTQRKDGSGGEQTVMYDTSARDAWLKAHRITRHHSLTEYLESLT